MRLNLTTRNHTEPKSGADAWTKYSMNVRSDDEYMTCYEENNDSILAGTEAQTHMETTWLRDLLLSVQHYIYLQKPALINTGENASITRFLDAFCLILIIPLL